MEVAKGRVVAAFQSVFEEFAARGVLTLDAAQPQGGNGQAQWHVYQRFDDAHLTQACRWWQEQATQCQ